MGDDSMDRGGTKPWMAEGRTMQEQLSRVPKVGALSDAGAATEFHEPQRPIHNYSTENKINNLQPRKN